MSFCRSTCLYQHKNGQEKKHITELKYQKFHVFKKSSSPSNKPTRNECRWWDEKMNLTHISFRSIISFFSLWIRKIQWISYSCSRFELGYEFFWCFFFHRFKWFQQLSTHMACLSLSDGTFFSSSLIFFFLRSFYFRAHTPNRLFDVNW